MITEANFVKSWEQIHRKSKGEGFSILIDLYVPTPDERRKLNDARLKFYDDPHQVQDTFYRSYYFVNGLDIPNTQFSDYSSFQQSSVDKFFNFLGLEHGELSFERLVPDSSIKYSFHGSLSVYSVFSLEDVIRADYMVEKSREGFKERDFFWTEIRNSCFGSFVSKRESVSMDGEGKISLVDKTKCALIGVGETPVLGYSAPLAEVAHHYFSSMRLEGIIRDLHKLFDMGRITNYEELNKYRIIAGDEWVQREEGLVHGLLHKWVKNIRKDLKFTYQDIEKLVSCEEREHYSKCKDVNRLDLGVENIIGLYRDEPDEIFGNPFYLEN